MSTFTALRDLSPFHFTSLLAYYAWPRTPSTKLTRKERNPWRQHVHRAARPRSYAIDKVWEAVTSRCLGNGRSDASCKQYGGVKSIICYLCFMQHAWSCFFFYCTLYGASRKEEVKRKGEETRKAERNKTGRKTKPKNGKKKTRKNTVSVNTYLASRRGRSCTHQKWSWLRIPDCSASVCTFGRTEDTCLQSRRTVDLPLSHYEVNL